MKKESIYLWDAIASMNLISKSSGEFAVSFYKLNRQTGKGGDFAHIPRARLRAKTPDIKIADSSHKLFFFDLDTDEARVCWEILIVEFNGMKCIL